MGNILPTNPAITSTQAQIFVKSLSKKPYCSNNLLHGLRIRSASTALKSRFIQPNHPNSQLWLLYDVDRPIGLETINDELNLPRPTFFVQNPANNHAHLYYGLHTAVHMNAGSSVKAQRFAGAVDVALSHALNADAGYVGLIAKNPLHEHWRTYSANEFYDLEDLSDFVDLTPYSDRRKRLPDVGLGRNVGLFDALRYWAYRAIRQGYPDFQQWQRAVEDRAIGINQGFETPLPYVEVKSTAKSVATYVHRNFDPLAFARAQSERGKRSGQARLALSEDKRAQAIEMRLNGWKITAIANVLGVSRPTIYSWLGAKN